MYVWGGNIRRLVAGQQQCLQLPAHLHRILKGVALLFCFKALIFIKEKVRGKGEEEERTKRRTRVKNPQLCKINMLPLIFIIAGPVLKIFKWVI